MNRNLLTFIRGKSSRDSKGESSSVSNQENRDSSPTLPSNSSGCHVVGEILPDRFAGTYIDDYNILEVHDILIKRFITQKVPRIEELERQKVIEHQKMSQPQTYIARRESQANVERIQRELDQLTSDADRTRYEEESKDLIEEYRKLGPIPKVITFSQEKQKKIEDPEIQEKRHQIITRYLDIARRYMPIDVIRDMPKSTGCLGCGYDLKEVIIDDNGTQYCPECGVEKRLLVRNVVSKDIAKVGSSRNGYEDRENFYKALMRYQGKQPNKIPSNLFAVLDAHFISYNLPVSEEVKKLPLTKRGTRGKTSHEMMFKALLDTGNSSYYEDVNLICHLYWNWVLPDVSHLEEQIMEDYDSTQQVYDRIPKARKSCLNTQFRLFKHLEVRGSPVTMDQFKIVKTREILEYHDRIWREMMEGAGLPFIPTI
jgi:rubrerythrin